jgi:glycyl-tRNA synthetase
MEKEKLRFKELSEEERAFYNKYHWDIELLIPEIGWKEVAGIHYRTDHDLGGHQKISKKDLTVTIEGKKILPHVLELSFGVDRNIFAFLVLGYQEEKERIVLKLPRMLSPFYAALFPLVNKDDIPEKAEMIKEILKNNFLVFYDDSGSIGRRYRRMDEIGVSLCITVDHQTLKDDTVTLRDRDSMKQVRVKIADLNHAIFKYLHGGNVESL